MLTVKTETVISQIEPEIFQFTKLFEMCSRMGSFSKTYIQCGQEMHNYINLNVIIIIIFKKLEEKEYFECISILLL